jgi:hypothetical protein
VAEGDEIAPARVASEAPGTARAPLHSSLIWIGLALALIGKVLSIGRAFRTKAVLSADA